VLISTHLKICTNKTSVAEVSKQEPLDQTENFSLDNPIEFDPSRMLTISQDLGTTNVPLFTHNCKIKNELDTLIFDNGNQKNIVSRDLVQGLHLPTTSHMAPYHLSCV